MTEWFPLLSSMTPDLKGRQKTVKKAITVLATKKHFRRSSIYDKASAVNNADLEIVEATTDSSENSSESWNTRKELFNLCTTKDKITEWLKSLDLEEKKTDLTLFSQVSTIYGEEQSKVDAECNQIATSSSFSNKAVRRFDELFIKNDKDDKLPLDDSFDIVNTSLKSRIEDESRKKSCSDENNSVIVIDDSFTSESKVDVSDKFKNLVINETLLTSDESLKKSLNNSKESFFTGDDTPDKENFVSLRKKGTRMIDKHPQTPVKEMESVLDSLYGTSWRAKQDQVLTFSEPRKKGRPKNIESLTERKPEKGAQPLHLPKSKLNFDRLKKPVCSPWVEKLKGLCDPDSSSEEEDDKHKDLKNVKTALNFCDDDLKETNNEPKSKNTSKKLSNNQNTFNNQTIKSAAVKNKSTKSNKHRSQSSSSSNSCDELDVSSDEEYDKEVTRLYEVRRKSIKPPSKGFSFLESLSGNVPLSKCDASARIFRTNFKTYRDNLVKKLFALYNEKVFNNVIPSDALIEWNEKLRMTAGLCYCRRSTHSSGKVDRTVRIALSSKILDSADRLRDTLIHEMCHAATWMVNNVSNGHGVYWKNWAFKAMKIFPELPPIKRCHNYAINSKYTYKCVKCGYSFGRHSKSLDLDRKRCGYCYGKFEVFLNKTLKSGETKLVPAASKKELTGFALFVKENYALYKDPLKKHGEIMKLLGQKFSELKVKSTM